ncbi:MAG: type VI secretion system contractile sheath large subunit [Halorhodospira halophila]|uniref:type VI secretion system contractile sheath large subunit n=1 Tax=Halorhodospira halophila TaxID=1053 RepID=UPI0026E992B4|nr:type VI secretion system contractile sheath large subunit [Halorhodospira halophila]MCC3750608.1 type VI secretion system contractile sheath large subunit [Halorhodospira halophila]
MTEQTENSAEAAPEASYARLCQLAEVEPVSGALEIATFQDSAVMADIPSESRLTAALQVFLDLASQDAELVERIDKALLDEYIARIDAAVSEQLDAVLHHPEFQRVEAAWRSLRFLVERSDPRANIKLELLDVSKEELAGELEDVTDITQSGLYQHVYVQEYDTPGGEPLAAMVSNYEFDCSAADINLLTEVSRIAAAAHCPFLGAVGRDFFGKAFLDEVVRIPDIASYLDKAEYARWRGFRDTEDARYVGLTLPRFLLRLPYGPDNPTRAFGYRENVTGPDHDRYLWGNAAFAFAANMARSFKAHGWTVNIRGPESGGKLEQLPIHVFDLGRGAQTKTPTEVLISENRELELAEAGFIPLSFYKNSDYACFFSANSAQRPARYSSPAATANARINARLPYIFLVSRLAHYLKVLQRENIGSAKSRQDLENELNDWLQGLVTKMQNPDPDLVATRPLREGAVEVEEVPENPGFYRVNMSVMPHFQIEGIDLKLSLVSQLPT